jgi:beta-galactosidase
MKIKLFLISFVLFIVSINTIYSQSTIRGKILFDLGWKFHLGDLNAAKDPSFDDATWRSINLPHDWSIEGDFNSQLASCTGYLPGGFGWYRKSFDIPQNYVGKTITIQFDGVYCNSEVWVNGKYIGKHPYGYTSFYYNLTPYLEIGKKNIIAVRVDHMKYADTRWYSGSGIYRHVWLTATNKLHVAQWGTHVLTPDITPSTAKVTVKTIVAIDNKVSKTIKLQSSLLNRDGKEVDKAETDIQLSDSLTSVDQAFSIHKPVLWDTEKPYLYKVKTKLLSGTDVIDEYETSFGVRTFKFDPDKGFFLNGVNTKIKGVCLHHDGGCVGAAVPEKIWKIRLEKLKAVGCNAIRTSHNPVAPEFLDLCDQMGFMVMAEAFDEWDYPKNKWIDGWNQTVAGHNGYPDIFEQCGEKDLYSMVYRDKNHPSIVIWSIGNELDYNNDPYSDPTNANYSPDKPDASRMVDVARKFVEIVKNIDTSRPVTMAIAVVPISNKLKVPEVLDIAGYNYTESAYQNDHKQYPKRIIYGSENSHNYSAWLEVKNNEFISGQFLWTGIDYMGEARRFPSHASTSGLLDLTSFEKPIYYWRQAMWSEKPMLYLTSRKVRATDQKSVDPMSNLAGFLNSSDQNEHWNYTVGDSVLVMAFTNCNEVELFLNGKSLGKKKSDPANSCMWWYVPYETGEVKAQAKGSENKTLTAMLKKVSEPIKIILTPDATKLKANNQDIAIVEVQLCDKNNNRSLLANNLIHFDISGEGKIIGVDNGDASSLENYKLPKRMARFGRCIVIVQATGKSGTIKLTAKSEGLPDGFTEILSE